MQPLSEAWRLKAKLSREAMLQVPGLGPRGSFVPIEAHVPREERRTKEESAVMLVNMKKPDCEVMEENQDERGIDGD